MFALLTAISGFTCLFTIVFGSATVAWTNVAIFVICGIIAEYQSGYFENK